MPRYFAAVLICAALGACGHRPPDDPIIVHDGGVARPYDPCPVEGTAKVEAAPKDPLTSEERNVALVMGLSETKAQAALRYDQVDMPGHARRLGNRLAKVQEWCAARKP